MFHKNDPQGYDRIILRRSKTVEGLADAEEIVIWDEENTDNSHRWIWAPEIHQINGTWYVFFTASVDKKRVWGIRPKVIVCNKGDKDLFKPENWETEAHPCEPHENDKTAYTVFSLDMTHFENKGTHYVAWAQIVGSSSVLLASVDEKEPWKATSEHMILTMPEFAWEWQNDRVNEGPAVIKNNGKIYIAYSASSVNETYCVGLMYADEDSDLLDPASWIKLRYPILSTEDLPGSLSGPGHNSFTVDEYGNPIIVYHVRDFDEPWPRDLYDAGRHAMVKRVNFAYDGTPVLNMTAEQELDPVNKKVTIEVIVE